MTIIECILKYLYYKVIIMVLSLVAQAALTAVGVGGIIELFTFHGTRRCFSRRRFRWGD